MQHFGVCKKRAFGIAMPLPGLLNDKYRQAVRIMKITAFILLVCTLHVSAGGYSQSITLSEKEAPLDKVFKAIEKQTDYIFFYNVDWVNKAEKVDVEVKNMQLQQVLDILFRNQPLTYSITGKMVTVFPKKNDGSSKDNSALPLPIDIHGKVVDENGKPAPGVTVTVKGSKKMAITDNTGEFNLSGISANDVLLFSSVNMEPFEVNVGGQTEILAKLKTKTSELDAVQIIAYGETTKRLLTGNIGTIKQSEIEKQPVNNPLLALEGRVPGVFITQNTGVPGGGITVRIQGQNSLGMGNDPLYVIDGVPYTSQPLPNISGPFGILGNNGNTSPVPSGGGNPLSFLNPSDIESIDVLKDADATAIYGSRASNGAILITTKKGKAGRTEVNVNFRNGWGKVTRTLDLLNTAQYMEMRHEAKANDNAVVSAGDYDLNGTWDTTRYTDWQKELIGGTAKYTDFNTAISGGNNNVQFLAGAGYHRETTVFPGDFADEKASIHFSVSNISTNQRFKFQLSGNYLVDNNRLINSDLTSTAIKLAPIAPSLHKDDGSLNWAPTTSGESSWYNPLAYLNGQYNLRTNNLIIDAVLSYEVLKGLNIKTNFGVTDLQSDETFLIPLTTYAPEVRPYSTRASLFSNGSIRSNIVEPQLTYKHSVGTGSLDLLFGTTFLENKNNCQQFLATGFNSDQVMKDILSASSVAPTQTIASLYRYNAFFGRANYNWHNKYILNLTARRDGSSRFGSSNLFHNFASVAGAWVFTNEKWFKKGTLLGLSYGKFRLSYGSTGNDQIGDYQFLNLYSPISVPMSYQTATGYAPTDLPNTHLQWEETKKLALGLDIGLLKDRILLNANYYRNRSSNQLQLYALPALAGFNSLQINFPAVVENTGWELSLNVQVLSRKDVKWSSSVNLTVPKNRLLKYPGLEQSNLANFYVVGKSVPVSRAFKFAGVDTQSGLFTFLDQKGQVTTAPSSPQDLTVLNVSFPRLYGGWANTFKYKGFELDVLFQFVAQDAANYKFGDRPGRFLSDNSGTLRSNQPVTVLDRWRKPGDESFFQKFSSIYPSNLSTPYNSAKASDAAFSDASFARLKNLSISWQLPEKWTQQLRLQKAQIYVQGQNLATITKYVGLDPENSSTTSLPPLKVLTLGAQLVF